MLIEQLPVWIRIFFRGVSWRKNPNKKTLYLTFDDGPIPGVTPWVLDILDKYKVKATFFCVGENVQKYPEIYQEILRRGHRTGNHTFNHQRGFLNDTKGYLANVVKAAEYIDSNLFRPPHGDLKLSQLRILRKEYEIVQWDVISRDYNRDLPKEKVLDIVKKYSRNGSIIVFHDSIKAEQNMKYAMPKALEYLVSKGFDFEKL
jgi:peptidoglycan/xylan/chitin deacetylase (PgdA/CDA1 family)